MTITSCISAAVTEQLVCCQLHIFILVCLFCVGLCFVFVGFFCLFFGFVCVWFFFCLFLFGFRLFKKEGQ